MFFKKNFAIIEVYEGLYQEFLISDYERKGDVIQFKLFQGFHFPSSINFLPPLDPKRSLLYVFQTRFV
jgi:hypothetical protein